MKRFNDYINHIREEPQRRTGPYEVLKGKFKIVRNNKKTASAIKADAVFLHFLIKQTFISISF